MLIFECTARQVLLATSISIALVSAKTEADTPGRPMSEDDIAAWDISIPPSGKGLPSGIGTVEEGAEVYSVHCAFCHGATGNEGPADRLVGGIGSLGSDTPIKTLGSFWPNATTAFDYIRRAMPFHAPGSLTDAEVYAVTAYLLHLNGILPEDAHLDAQGLRDVSMPNVGGFVPAYPSGN